MLWNFPSPRNPCGDPERRPQILDLVPITELPSVMSGCISLLSAPRSASVVMRDNAPGTSFGVKIPSQW